MVVQPALRHTLVESSPQRSYHIRLDSCTGDGREKFVLAAVFLCFDMLKTMGVPGVIWIWHYHMYQCSSYLVGLVAGFRLVLYALILLSFNDWGS